MTRERFHVSSATSYITEESSQRGDYDRTEEGDEYNTDLSGALAALDSDCWDNVDVRGDGSIIAYPADYQQDYRTGEYEGTTLFIQADTLRNAERAFDLWSARKKERLRRIDARSCATLRESRYY
jgi:hypothetical protein